MKLRVIICLFLAAVTYTLSTGQQDNKKITLSGYVTDEVKKPIVNAIVMIDGKNSNHVTNNKGFYKIKVKSGCSKIGIFTISNGLVEQPINGRSNINFTFKGSVSDQINDTINPAGNKVNIGYGTIDAKDLTTPVSKSAREKSNYDSYRTIYDLIQGELPGVRVSGTSIKIQGGASSFSLSSEPLFVIDGIPSNSIDNIQPVMVKSIQVLKGSSAAIYGSRGANGVIIIELIGAKDR